MTLDPPPRDAGPDHGGADAPTPGIEESLRTLASEGRETLSSALDSGRALRKLVSADFALARSALGRALAWTGVAIVFGASSWLLLMGALIALLRATGLSWLAALGIAAGISLLVAVLAAWRVTVFFDHAGMHATRRQLSRLGLFDEADAPDGQGDGDRRREQAP